MILRRPPLLFKALWRGVPIQQLKEAEATQRLVGKGIEDHQENGFIYEYLNDYLSITTSPNYAVMIRGPWGVGKTFLIRNILAEHFPDGKGYIYVSLYGVTKPEEIDAAILAAMYPVLGGKAGKLVGGLLTTGLKYFNVSIDLKLSELIGRASTAAYVFDDIERSSMSSEAIFGYINQFVEHAGCRVILVANETELEKTVGYRSKREKLVGQTLEVKSTVRGALQAFVADIADPVTRNYLASSRECIVELYEQGDVSNLRVLKQTLWDFARFYAVIKQDHRQHVRAMRHILRLFFALSFEFKLGRLEAADLTGRRERWIAAAFAKEPDPGIKTAVDRYKDVDLSDTALSDELLVGLLSHGVVNIDLVQRDLSASSWFLEPQDEPSWRTIWHHFEREDDLLTGAIAALETEMIEYKYNEPGEILHVFGVMLMMSDAAFISMTRRQVVDNAMAYIVVLRDMGQLPPLRPNSFLEDIRHGSWGGLGFTASASCEFGEIYRFLNDQRTKARVERLPALANTLMADLENDPDLFRRRLVDHGGEQSDVIDGPVLKEIEPDAFLEAVFRQPAQVQFNVFQSLLSRYRDGSLYGDLKEEQSWVKALHAAMLLLAESSSPIRRHKLKMFAHWIGNICASETASEADAMASA